MTETTSKRLLISSGSPYEPIIGFSRAVRVGNIVAIGGTAACSGGKPVAIGDPAAQTRAILAIIAKALEDAGAISPARLRGDRRRGVGLHGLRLLDDECKVREDGFLKHVSQRYCVRISLVDSSEDTRREQ